MPPSKLDPSKAAMKAALRVLTALSDRQEPDPADVDELHWYSPSERERPLDELVCDAIQRALKDREQKRKVVKAQEREKVLALTSPEYEPPQAAPDLVFPDERDREMEQLTREHQQRLRQYFALSAKLKRLGVALEQAGANITGSDAETFAATEAARDILESAAADVDLSAITRLLDEHVRLAKQLAEDQRALRQRGDGQP
jgi:hypothetical protein